MARRSPARGQRGNLYRVVWLGDPFMLNRLELIVRTGQDSFPGSSNSAILEKALAGLVEGRPLKAVPEVEHLNTQVRAAIGQLFRMRDAGKIGA